jgi:predicted outer membrane repeat protein
VIGLDNIKHVAFENCALVGRPERMTTGLRAINVQGLYLENTNFSNFLDSAMRIYNIEYGEVRILMMFSFIYCTKIQRSMFLDNLGEDGAAIFLSSTMRKSFCKITNSKFANNRATKSGGALFYDTKAVEDVGKNQLVLNNNTLSKNKADIRGGAIFWNYLAPNILKNNVFENNSAGIYADDIGAYPIALLPHEYYFHLTLKQPLDYDSPNEAIKEWCPLFKDGWRELKFLDESS